MKEKFSLSLDQLEEWSTGFIANLEPQSLVLLSGDLGAGKSLLVKQIVKACGGGESQSPTYSLINEYQTKTFPQVYHVDLYRLEDEEDLESIGFWDLFESTSSLVFIEWADRLDASALPLGWKKYFIHISKDDDEAFRTYEIRSE